MAGCETLGCNRRINPHSRHCCRLCFEARAGGYPPDEHTPECNLRHAAAGDSVVADWVAIYDAVAKLAPDHAESWRHLKYRFYGTDIGILEQSEWGMICAQLREIRSGDHEWLRILNGSGLCINLKTGKTNMPEIYPDFKVKFPAEEEQDE